MTINHEERCVVYDKHDIHPTQLAKLRKGAITPFDLLLQHLGYGLSSADLTKERIYIHKKNYRAELQYSGKKYLIIYNK
jgi:hypothetical protein